MIILPMPKYAALAAAALLAVLRIAPTDADAVDDLLDADAYRQLTQG